MNLPWPVTKFLLKTLLTFFVFFFLFFNPSAVRAATFNIPPSDTSALISAINEANATAESDTINLANSSAYTLVAPVSNPSFDSSYGPNGLPVISSEIVINGNNSTIIRDSAASRFRILAVGSGGILTLNDLTISGGFSTHSDYGGGGILNLDGTLNVNQSTISENKAFTGGGGGVWILSQFLTTITSTIVSNNNVSISASGGGIIKRGSGNLNIIDSTFSDNSTSDNNGGAIYNNSSGLISIESSIFSNNTALNHGGAIHNHTGTISINKSTFQENRVTSVGTYGFGGAIYATENLAQILITNSRFNNNYAFHDGGFFYNNNGLGSSIAQSCISNNSSNSLANFGPHIDAAENWWGGPDGPNQTGADTVSGNVTYDPWLSSCPPLASPSPSPEPSPSPAPDPVVFLPGFGASWNSQALLTGGNGGTWHKTPFIQVYDNLKNTFLANGFTENTDYFEWYYDWRKRLDTLADDLKNYLDSNIFPTLEPDTKIDLVGHSQGGLVARIYAQKYGTARIDDLVTSGSPHQGAIPAYLAWTGAETDKFWQTLGLNLYLHLFQGRFTSPVTAIQTLSPGLQDLLPIFDFAKDQNGNPIPVNSMISTNSYLLELTANLTPALTDLLTTIAGINQETVEWLNLDNRTLADRLLNRWPDGRPTAFELTPDGDTTVLGKSAKVDNADLVDVNNTHTDMVQSTEGIAAIMAGLGLNIIPQTGSEQPPLIPGLLFLLHSPAELTVTVPGGGQAGFGVTDPIPGSVYSQQDKLIFIFNAAAGNYPVTVTGNGNGRYQLDIGQITTGGNLWSSLIDDIQSGQTDNWTVNFNPDQPLDDPVIDDIGSNKISQAKLRLKLLQQQANNRWLTKYLTRVISLLDKNNLRALRLALASTYKFRFWVDRLANSQPELKHETDQIGQLLTQALVNQGQNTRQLNRRQVQSELKAAAWIKDQLGQRLEQLADPHPALGNTWELINRYLNRARQSFDNNLFWRAHTDALVVRILAIEAWGLIR